MVSYDSDDEDFDAQSYQETDVLLGYASKEANGETISRLGGRPDWFDTKTPDGALAECKSCKDPMVLLLQLNAELPDRFPTHERRLYVFSCRKKTCRRKEGSIRAIRGVRFSAEEAAPKVEEKKKKEEVESKKEEKKPTPAASTGLGESLFGVKPLAGAVGSLNPFSSGSGGGAINPFSKPAEALAAVNPFAKPTPEEKPVEEKTDQTATEKEVSKLPKTFAETLSLNNDTSKTTSGPAPPPQPWPQEKDLPPAYPVSWLAEAEYEVLEPTRLPKIEQATMEVDSATDATAGGKEDKVTYESTMDTTFQKFADRVGQNPEQCIRYEYGGVPLLYAKGDEVSRLLEQGDSEGKVRSGKGMPRCERCGAGRVLEVQLMPHAIEVLEEEEEGMEGMDWGTVIVGVCERDCGERGQGVGEAGYVEEWCGVQWEEVVSRR